MRRVRRRDRRMWFFVLAIFVAVFLFSFLTQKFKSSDEEVEAASLANFDPGYIISDWQMGNYTSMSEAEIQAFLTKKNPCSNRDYAYYQQLSAWNPGVIWHFENGHFICLSEERFGDGEKIGSGETAAHIIWQAAQDYKINPQVLIVLLQKESSLITDPIPNNYDYRSATGYGCPDTAPCSSEYYGFKNQVRKAASLFSTVLNGGWTNYPLGNNYVQYNPNPACGGTIVNIRSLATSALYRYTPYQPNAGAIAAGYGAAACGAYGNRNFYLYFEDWFGGVTWDGWADLGTVLSKNRIKDEETDLDFEYRTHLQHYGWLDWVGGGKMSGTAGYSVQAEALSIKLKNNLTGVEYKAYVEEEGWGEYKKDGEVAGTTGKSLSIKAVQIKLNDELAEKYDIYYRTHVSNIGWMDWVKNDEVAGRIEDEKKIEAIQIKIVKRKMPLETFYRVHVQNIGWMGFVENEKSAGTTGRSLRLEAIEIKLDGELAEQANLNYRVHVQNIGWMDWVKNGAVAGTTGRSLRLEAIEIKLDDEMAERYDIVYRVHVQNIGWMDWVKNGAVAGTTGRSLRLEAIEIKLETK